MVRINVMQAGLLALPAPPVHVETNGASATGGAPIEFLECTYGNGSGGDAGDVDSSGTDIELS